MSIKMICKCSSWRFTFRHFTSLLYNNIMYIVCMLYKLRWLYLWLNHVNKHTKTAIILIINFIWNRLFVVIFFFFSFVIKINVDVAHKDWFIYIYIIYIFFIFRLIMCLLISIFDTFGNQKRKKKICSLYSFNVIYEDEDFVLWVRGPIVLSGFFNLFYNMRVMQLYNLQYTAHV